MENEKNIRVNNLEVGMRSENCYNSYSNWAVKMGVMAKKQQVWNWERKHGIAIGEDKIQERPWKKETWVEGKTKPRKGWELRGPGDKWSQILSNSLLDWAGREELKKRAMRCNWMIVGRGFNVWEDAFSNPASFTRHSSHAHVSPRNKPVDFL